MSGSLSPQEFVAKWRKVKLKERSASQSHFNDLCRLASHPTPVEADPTGEHFTFEAGAANPWPQAPAARGGLPVVRVPGRGRVYASGESGRWAGVWAGVQWEGEMCKVREVGRQG